MKIPRIFAPSAMWPGQTDRHVRPGSDFFQNFFRSKVISSSSSSTSLLGRRNKYLCSQGSENVNSSYHYATSRGVTRSSIICSGISPLEGRGSEAPPASCSSVTPLPHGTLWTAQSTFFSADNSRGRSNGTASQLSNSRASRPSPALFFNQSGVKHLSARILDRLLFLSVLMLPLLLNSLIDLSEHFAFNGGPWREEDVTRGVSKHQSLLPFNSWLFAAAQLKVLAPKHLADFFQDDLKETGGIIPGSTAAFGAPMYGEVVVGRLVAYNSSLCDDDEKDLTELGSSQKSQADHIVDGSTAGTTRTESPSRIDISSSSSTAVAETTPKTPGDVASGKGGNSETQENASQVSDLTAASSETEHNEEEPRIIVVERGVCTFVKKARNGEKLGAFAMIVVDSSESRWKRPEIRHVILSGNGEGAAKIDIPSLMVTYDDGKRLLEAIKKGDEVYASLEWSLPVRDMVDIDFWADPASPRGTDFLVSFAPYARQLKGRIRFALRFYLFELPKDYRSLCLSIKNANFCANAPVSELTDHPIAGSDIVREDLRQLCLLKHTSSEISSLPGSLYSDAYWEYVEQWGKECRLKGGMEEMQQFGSACSNRILESLDSKAGLDVQRVKNCMANEEEAFQLLQNEVENRAWGELAMRINEIAFSGRLESGLVARAACSAFADMPESCKSVLKDIRRATGSRYGKGDGWGSSLGAGMVWGSGWSLLVIVLTVISLLGLAAFLYQRHLSKTMRQSLREEVMLEVRTQMQEYQQMPEDVTEERAMRSHTESRPLIF